MLHPLTVCGETSILQPFGRVEYVRTTQYSELRIVAGRKHDEGVFGGEDLIRDN